MGDFNMMDSYEGELNARWKDYEDIEKMGCEDPWFFYPDHLNSKDCWCEPELSYEDPETGNQVWVHREVQ